MAQPPYSYPGAPVGGDYYPPAAAYPPQPSAPGYPPNPAYAQQGYPPQPGAYPPPSSGYPPQPGAASYPPAPGYPPQPGAGSYPPQPGAAYPPQPAASGYPPQPGYPPQATPGYTPQPTPGYGYPPQATPGYPPQPTPAYPPQPAAGYPPAQPAAGYGYAPQATATYPGQPAYPPQAGYPGGSVPAPQFPQAPIVAQSVYPTATAVQVQVTGVAAASSYLMPRMDAGTVFPAPNFNVETDCETLRHAMKGLGTDEKAIIEVLTHRSNAQRQEIVKKYKTMYGKDLIKELRSELTGNFEHAIISLMLTPPEFRAKEMRDAMKGAGTDEVGLIQVLCTSSNQMIHDTRDAYKRMYDRNLEKDIEKETSGHFKRLLIACANGSRNETSTVDMNKAQNLAEQLYRAGAAKMGTDETGFLRVLSMASVKPAGNFNVEADCETLRNAMKGIGTDEKAIINVLAHRSNAQRQEILHKFKTMYGKDLIKDLRSELTGNFEHTIIALMLTPAEFRAKELRDAMKGAGTNEETLIQILCTASNQEIHETRAAYKRLYSHELEEDLEKETSGHFKRVLVACANGNRNETPHVDHDKAKALAEQLHKAGAAKLGTDETGFLRVLANESAPQLRATFEAYHKMYGKTIEEVLKSEMSGDLLRSLLAITRCATNGPAYFAKALYDSMAGAGTRDHELSRIVVMRCEVDMEYIKQEFQKAHNKTLASMITGDTSGDYKHVLLALIGEKI